MRAPSVGQAGGESRTGGWPSVDALVVSFNSAASLAECLACLRAQTVPVSLVCVDNGSVDGSAEIISRLWPQATLLRNAGNLGFAAAVNQGLALGTAPWVLLVNPDVVLEPDYVERLLRAGLAARRVGSLTGKLLRAGALEATPIFDSTGLFVRADRRALDRGAGQEDRGQYARDEWVFGVSAAAGLYRRRMLEDVACSGEVLDEDLFCYREDVDLAWRAKSAGWRAMYVAGAVGRHNRRFRPESREHSQEWVRRIGVRNRYLVGVKNETLATFLPSLPAILARELALVAYCALRERATLRAIPDAMKLFPRLWRKRRLVRRRAPALRLLRWLLLGTRAARPVGPKLIGSS